MNDEKNSGADKIVGSGDGLAPCGHVPVRKSGMFYWRGRTFHGLVCEQCNALFDDPTDSFMAHVMCGANGQADLTPTTKAEDETP